MTDKKPKTPFYLIDTNSEFYRPIGMRLAICISVAIWAAIEIYNGDGFWGVISGAAAVYVTYVLLLTYTPPPEQVAAIPAEEPEEADEAPPAPKDADKP